ncbi:ankyrin repeat-containing domain protein [Baffinella frigidus]|nr:ankyrin repeat-containing domain protein [Cryptophyta sp. CCMP2293]
MAPPRTLLVLALFAAVSLLVWAPVAAQEESQEGGLPLVEQLAGLVWNRNVGSIDGGEAAFRKQVERMVTDAVAAGANLDSMDHEGRTPLHWAAANGEVAVVQSLVQEGADLNLGCRYAFQSPLHYASRWGRTEVAKELVDSGADVWRRDRSVCPHAP